MKWLDPAVFEKAATSMISTGRSEIRVTTSIAPNRSVDPLIRGDNRNVRRGWRPGSAGVAAHPSGL